MISAAPYIIIEIANTHGGDFNYVKKLLSEFSAYNKNVGIKFQPFKYDEIALDEFQWFPVYKTLFFDEGQWKEIIREAKQTKEIWIDVFDNYSVRIIEQNLNEITGLKFQVSTLDNVVLFNHLKKINLSDKLVVVNVASLEIDLIKYHVEAIQKALKPKEIIIQRSEEHTSELQSQR